MVQPFADLTQAVIAVVGVIGLVVLYFFYRLRYELPAPGNVIGFCKFICLDRGEEISGDVVEVDRDYVIPYFEGVIDDTLSDEQREVFEKYRNTFAYKHDGNYPIHCYAVRSSTNNLDPETQGRHLFILSGDIIKYGINTGGGYGFPFHRNQQYTILVSSRLWRAGNRKGFNVKVGCIVDPKTVVVEMGRSNPSTSQLVKKGNPVNLPVIRKVQPLVEATLEKQLSQSDAKTLGEVIPSIQSFAEHDRSVKQFKAQAKQAQEELGKQMKENQDLRSTVARLRISLQKKSLTGESNVAVKDTLVEKTQRWLGVITSLIGYILFVNFLPKFQPQISTIEAGAIGILVGAGALWLISRA